METNGCFIALLRISIVSGKTMRQVRWCSRDRRLRGSTITSANVSSSTAELTLVMALTVSGHSAVQAFLFQVEWHPQRELMCEWPVIPEEAYKQRYWNIDNLPSRPW